MRSPLLLGWCLTAFVNVSAAATPQQNSDSPLPAVTVTAIDDLAQRTANEVRSRRAATSPPKVVVINFLQKSGEISSLDTELADRFSTALAAQASGFQVLDRKLLRDYLSSNFLDIRELASPEVCKFIASEIGADAFIRGELEHKRHSHLSLRIQIIGLGQPSFETAQFDENDRMKALAKVPAPFVTSAIRYPDDGPQVVQLITPDMTPPHCITCPLPELAGQAHTGNHTVLLSALVSTDGSVGNIRVLRGAPFLLTSRAIASVERWKMAPAKKDGKPVAARLKIEVQFSLR